jgi:nucleotide-binding universal stress UspA family protein
MSIVCGTDYSAKAAEAGTVAALLAARIQEPLILLYALDDLADFRVDAEAARAYESVFELAKQRLPAEAERLRGFGATVEEVFVTGAADEALVSRATRADARLIVLASTGRRGVSRWLLGSVAERTVRSSLVPVLVVRAPAPLEAWLRGERPLRIIVATDLSPTSDLAIRWAMALRAIAPCHITVAHAATTTNPHEAQALERDLRRRMDEWAAAEIHVMVNSETGPAGRHLATLAATEQADLLVLGTRQRTGVDRLWCGTVAGEALFLAQTNVACVPALAPAEQRTQPIPEMHTILAATDFSKTGNAAVAHAFGLVARGGIVHLVHVVQPPRFQSTFSAPSADLTFTVDEAPEHHLARQLAALVPGDSEPRGITSGLAIIENRDVVQGICAAAKRLKVDAICMGNRGHSPLAEAVLGSVARGVANHATVPVLLVPFARE